MKNYMLFLIMVIFGLSQILMSLMRTILKLNKLVKECVDGQEVVHSVCCMLYFLNYAISHCIISPNFKSFHILCRISTLSKMMQLLIIWGFWLWNYIFGSAFNLRVSWLIYPMWFQHIMLLLSVIMTLNIVVFENFYLLYPEYGLWKTCYLIANAYLFQMFYNCINLWALVTFWKNKWVVSTHGQSS